MNKEFVYLIHKILLKINNKKTKTCWINEQKLYQMLTKHEISMVNEHMKRCPTSLVTREIK